MKKIILMLWSFGLISCAPNSSCPQESLEQERDTAEERDAPAESEDVQEASAVDNSYIDQESCAPNDLCNASCCAAESYPALKFFADFSKVLDLVVIIGKLSH